MALNDFPEKFNLVIGDIKQTCFLKKGTAGMVGSGFEYDENGLGYGLSLNMFDKNYPQTVINLSEKNMLEHNPIKGTYETLSWRGNPQTINGFYMLCECEVECFGKPVTTKAILFFQSIGIQPFYIYHDASEEKTIAQFKALAKDFES